MLYTFVAISVVMAATIMQIAQVLSERLRANFSESCVSSPLHTLAGINTDIPSQMAIFDTSVPSLRSGTDNH